MQDEADKKTATSDLLPFAVELWSADGKPQVLGRAESITLARAIFTAARNEHPQHRLTLRKAGQVIADTQAR
jgi:hypothetical protein